MSSTKIRISERGKKLRKFRKLQRLTQAQLAAEVGCTGGNISDIERGKSQGSNALIRAIEQRFSMKLTEGSVIYKEEAKGEERPVVTEPGSDYPKAQHYELMKRIKELPPEGAEKLIDAIARILDLIEGRV